MTTTYALVLRPPRAKDGLCPVRLHLPSGRQPTATAVPDVAVSEKHWNEGGTLEKHNWVRKIHPYADSLNETLRKLMRQTQQLLDHHSISQTKEDYGEPERSELSQQVVGVHVKTSKTWVK